MKCSKYLIYGLKNSTGNFFYVGQSKTYLSRVYSHFLDSKNSKTNKVTSNEDCDFEILEELDSDETIDSRELWWIYHLHAKGFDLINKEVIGNKKKKLSISGKNKARPDSVHRMCNILRVRSGLSQKEAHQRIGVGIRFLKDLESGKETCQLDKVEQVLNFYGYTICARPMTMEEKDY